jgi:LysM repeat protein
MPDEPSLHDILRGSLAHHAEHLGDPSADIATVWSRVDRRRARRRGIAVVGSVVAVAAGAAGIMLVANPNGSTAPLDGSDGSAALAWACTGPLGSDGTYDYFDACDQRPRPVAPSTMPVSIVGSTIAGSVIASAPVLSAPAIGTAPPTTAFSPFVSQQQYVVVEGDSYFSITDRFGLEPDALHNYNGWPEGIEHMLVIGEQVLIPPTDIATVSTLVYAEQRHAVAPGDSLAAIADRYGVDLNTLVNYNAWPDGLDHPIFPGDVVLIPPGAAAPLAPQCVTPTAPPTAPTDGTTTTTTTYPPPGTVTCVAYPPPTAPPTLAPVGSVTVWTRPTCAPTTTAPADVSDESVPCGSAPDELATGPYRCTGLLGADELYRYYTSCEQTSPAGAPASTITLPGTVAAAATTTTTTTYPPPASESGDAATASTVPGEVRYTIGVGDNPSKVADMFGITVDVLVELNPEISQTFSVGQVLRLPPGSTVVDPQEQQYVTVAGDSLISIAERYGIDVETLVAYNAWAEGIAHPLIVDETVKIPPGAAVLGLG